MPFCELEWKERQFSGSSPLEWATLIDVPTFNCAKMLYIYFLETFNNTIIGQFATFPNV